MKLARTLLFLMLLPTAVRAQTNAYAYGYFLAPDGSLALVNIIRTQDPATNLITTELLYTFCGQAGLGAPCQRGDGLVPNSAVSGGVYTEVNRPDVLTLKVDTSTIAGYRNELCVGGVADFGDCLGSTPATGGLVSISWTRTNAWANIETSSGKSYQLGKLVSSGSSMLGTFSANQTGTVLGVSAVNQGGAVMVTSTDSQRLKEKFAALKVRTK